MEQQMEWGGEDSQTPWLYLLASLTLLLCLLPEAPAFKLRRTWNGVGTDLCLGSICSIHLFHDFKSCFLTLCFGLSVTHCYIAIILCFRRCEIPCICVHLYGMTEVRIKWAADSGSRRPQKILLHPWVVGNDWSFETCSIKRCWTASPRPAAQNPLFWGDRQGCAPLARSCAQVGQLSGSMRAAMWWSRAGRLRAGRRTLLLIRERRGESAVPATGAALWEPAMAQPPPSCSPGRGKPRWSNSLPQFSPAAPAGCGDAKCGPGHRRRTRLRWGSHQSCGFRSSPGARRGRHLGLRDNGSKQSRFAAREYSFRNPILLRY